MNDRVESASQVRDRDVTADDSEPINLNPGPVPIAESTRQAMAGPLVSHRSGAFEDLYRGCQARLERVFQTENEVIIVNGNGNLGLELAIANGIRPDDRVLCLSNGKFGENLEEMVGRHTGDIHVLRSDWGSPFDFDEIASALDDGPDAVVMTHCETSTGMLNPISEVADMAAEVDALSVVDGVSSVGGEPLPVDDWGIDFAVTASQKCLSAPPGLSVVTVSDRAKARASDNPRIRPYNLDLGRYQAARERDQTPSTAPVPTYRALRQSLTDILEIGLDETIAKLARRAEALRQAGTALGFEIFPRPNAYSRVSNTVTVLTVPEAISAPELVQELEARGILVRTGIGQTADRVIRLATMSNALSDDDIVRAISALEAVLEPLVDPIDTEGVKAATEPLSPAS